MTPPTLRVAVSAAAIGGALGALARWGLTELWQDPPEGFPWPVFAINVVGCALLAAMPLVPVVRRSSWLSVFIGTGLLGGFTTMSTASQQSFSLLHRGHALTGLSYAVGTLLAALVAVWLVDTLSTRADRALIESAGADE